MGSERPVEPEHDRCHQVAGRLATDPWYRQRDPDSGWIAWLVMSALRCLWVTRFPPFPPFYGGDALYSGGLVTSLVAGGASVTVLCHENGARIPMDTPNLTWVAVPFRDPGSARSLFGHRPAIAYRFSTPEILARFSTLVHEESWDAIVVDGLAMGEAVSQQAERDHRPHGTTKIYVAHNHESSLRRQLADKAPSLSPTRLALRLDAAKTRSYENELLSNVDLVTVTTDRDARLFKGQRAEVRTLTLSPGYDGSTVHRRTIDGQTPRRIVILGSYAWVAKQFNILRFLRAAAGPLAAAGIGIDVVGSIPREFATRIRGEFPSAIVTGVVNDASSYLRSARIGVIAEEIGGGFKLKALDYVFNRVPVAALVSSTAGLPLQAGVSVFEFADTGQMVEGILNSIDDFPSLNAMHEAAFLACEDRFQWEDRGRLLSAALRGAN